MKIPEVADELRQLAVDHQLPRLEQLADELRRRPPTRRAPMASAAMTPQLRADIRRYIQAHPDETFARVGEHFNVNAGRVSETMSGYRE